MADTNGTTTDQESGGAGQEPAAKTFDADYVSGIRAEAAKYRTDAKALELRLAELEPLAQKAQKLEEASQSETEKLATKMAEMTTQLNAAQAAAKQAVQAQTLTTLAVKAGVPAELLPFLDVSKFDLEDEEATLATLQALGKTTIPSGGAASNPARNSSNGEPTPAEWYENATGKSPSIFGG